MNVNAQSRVFARAGFPTGLNTGYILATRAFPAAALRAIVASIARNRGSAFARCSTSTFQAPVRMISALGAAARSWPTIEVRREANRARPADACDRIQTRSPLHAGENSANRSLPHSVKGIGLTCPR